VRRYDRTDTDYSRHEWSALYTPPCLPPPILLYSIIDLSTVCLLIINLYISIGHGFSSLLSTYLFDSIAQFSCFVWYTAVGRLPELTQGCGYGEGVFPYPLWVVFRDRVVTPPQRFFWNFQVKMGGFYVGCFYGEKLLVARNHDQGWGLNRTALGLKRTRGWKFISGGLIPNPPPPSPRTVSKTLCSDLSVQ